MGTNIRKLRWCFVLNIGFGIKSRTDSYRFVRINFFRWLFSDKLLYTLCNIRISLSFWRHRMHWKVDLRICWLNLKSVPTANSFSFLMISCLMNWIGIISAHMSEVHSKLPTMCLSVLPPTITSLRVFFRADGVCCFRYLTRYAVWRWWRNF